MSPTIGWILIVSYVLLALAVSAIFHLSFKLYRLREAHAELKKRVAQPRAERRPADTRANIGNMIWNQLRDDLKTLQICGGLSRLRESNGLLIYLGPEQEPFLTIEVMTETPNDPELHRKLLLRTFKGKKRTLFVAFDPDLDSIGRLIAQVKDLMRKEVPIAIELEWRTKE